MGRWMDGRTDGRQDKMNQVVKNVKMERHRAG